MTLREWLHSVEQQAYNPWAATKVIGRTVYIPDMRQIEHQRTRLFDLSDYVVSGVTGGSLTLFPRSDDIRLPAIVQCADCGVRHDGDALPSHECPQQRRANRRAQRIR